MKTALLINLLVFLFVSCGKKMQNKNADLPKQTIEIYDDCKDSLADLTLINNKTVEIRVSFSNKTSTRQGNTIVNSWKGFQTTPIPAGDSITVKLKHSEQFMFTVYGPVSTNVNGLGVIQEEKFTLLPCEKRRTGL